MSKIIALSAEPTLSGRLSCDGGLSGSLSIVSGYDVYSGAYDVVPKAYNSQTLLTANKLLNENIIVKEVPYYETGNSSNGVTAYIAKEA